MRTARYALIVPLLFLCLPACTEQQHAPLTPDEQRTARAYADILMFHEQRRADPDQDSVAYAARVDSVLRVYGFQRGEFVEEFLRISQTRSSFKSFLDSTEAAIRELRRRQVNETDS